MFFEDLFYTSPQKPITVCLMGAGQFGASFARQAKKIPNLTLRAICSLEIDECINAFLSSGITREKIAPVFTKEEAQSAYDKGYYLAARSFNVLEKLGMDVLVESSGAPEASARAALSAIENKMHVIMASKETESIVGPILAKKAQANNVVYTTGDGDQPSILIGLISWARALGLNVIAAGKSSEYDFIYDPKTKKILCRGQKQEFSCDLEKYWYLESQDSSLIDEKRKSLMPSLKFRANPDLCEMVLVSNATGFGFDTKFMHAPVARIPELADFFSPQEHGGVLGSTGVLDIFNCLRKPDELSMAGGEFIIITCDDQEIWDILEEKGHILSRNRKFACIYEPRHLMGLEIATSIMAAAVMNHATAGKNVHPVSDMLPVATGDLKAGTVLKMGGHHHTIDNVGAMVGPYQKLKGDNPVPFYLLSNATLKKDVKKGSPIVLDDLDISSDSILYLMRKEQDESF